MHNRHWFSIEREARTLGFAGTEGPKPSLFTGATEAFGRFFKDASEAKKKREEDNESRPGAVDDAAQSAFDTPEKAALPKMTPEQYDKTLRKLWFREAQDPKSNEPPQPLNETDLQVLEDIVSTDRELTPKEAAIKKRLVSRENTEEGVGSLSKEEYAIWKKHLVEQEQIAREQEQKEKEKQEKAEKIEKETEKEREKAEEDMDKALEEMPDTPPVTSDAPPVSPGGYPGAPTGAPGGGGINVNVNQNRNEVNPVFNNQPVINVNVPEQKETGPKLTDSPADVRTAVEAAYGKIRTSAANVDAANRDLLDARRRYNPSLASYLQTAVTDNIQRATQRVQLAVDARNQAVLTAVTSVNNELKTKNSVWRVTEVAGNIFAYRGLGPNAENAPAIDNRYAKLVNDQVTRLTNIASNRRSARNLDKYIATANIKLANAGVKVIRAESGFGANVIRLIGLDRIS